MDDLLSAIIRTSGRLIACVSQVGAFDVLCEEIAAFIKFDNFIVYLFNENREPHLFQTNRGLPRLKKSMESYIKGVYLLDPFHRLTVEGAIGLFRMRDIMPEDFEQSEYFNRFYQHTGVFDELRYIFPSPAGTIHIFIEREGGPEGFQPRDLQLLGVLQPLVQSFANAHLGWYRSTHERVRPDPGNFDLRTKIHGMRPGALTAREVETLEFMLKGHSTKSIARLMSINGGTVANHKRSIYNKLDIHSQAQMFDLFLHCLSQPQASLLTN